MNSKAKPSKSSEPVQTSAPSSEGAPAPVLAKKTSRAQARGGSYVVDPATGTRSRRKD